ncbi:MAG: flagellar type III secretion system pore protein FliP [Clostridiales bacterium]
MKTRKVRVLTLITISSIIVLIMSSKIYGETEIALPNIGIDLGTSDDPKEVSSSIQILLILTILSIAPSILIMTTSFTRIIIILSFVRNALGTQQMPPNQVLIGLSLFLTFFIMSPVGMKINNEAFKPYSKGKITQKKALDITSKTIKNFMYKHTRKKDLTLFIELSNIKKAKSKDEVPLTTVIPAFLISELKTAFQIGFLVFIPFLIIDMVVSSVLMSMGMMMLPPIMISLPFKILLFILVDGWNLITQSIVSSFIK